jgi:hypothetical protein
MRGKKLGGGQVKRMTKRILLSLLFVFAATTAYGQRRIVGISIACSNDHVYTWYSDRTVSVGTSENLEAYQPPHPYSLPFGKSPNDIVEIGIARNDHVFTWYTDRTVSSGTSTDLDKYQPRHPYRLPQFESVASRIVGIDIACSDDHVYAWYTDSRVSSGTTDDLDKYSTPGGYFPATTRTPDTIIGIGIARNDHVYTWYRGGKASSGTSRDLDSYRTLYEFVMGPGPCDISADAPKIIGRSVFGVGIRGPTCGSQAEIVVRLRAIGSDAKILSEKRVSGTNFEVPVTYSCAGTRTRTLFTEVESPGRIVKSANTDIAGCF